MKNLFVIGNGFDIFHGLDTKYKSFLMYLENENKTLHKLLCKYICEKAMWSNMEKELGEIDYETLKEDNYEYCLNYHDDDWKDSANHDFQNMIEASLSFSEKVPCYFREWIKEINTKLDDNFDKISDITSIESLFLNFNYTDTLEKNYFIPEKNILYIHGKALRNDKLIIGHNNKKFENDYENNYEDVRVIEGDELIYNYFKSTFKDTEKIYAANIEFFKLLSKIEKIYIYGHSLSYVDFNYFLEIKKHTLPNAYWHISYFDSEDKRRAEEFVKELNLERYKIYPINNK